MDCLLCETCLSVVMRHEFGLCLTRLWQLGFQDVGNALMVLLSRTFQQGGVGGILDEGMLKRIRRLWWSPSVVDNLCLDEPIQLML